MPSLSQTYPILFPVPAIQYRNFRETFRVGELLGRSDLHSVLWEVSSLFKESFWSAKYHKSGQGKESGRARFDNYRL